MYNDFQTNYTARGPRWRGGVRARVWNTGYCSVKHSTDKVPHSGPCSGGYGVVLTEDQPEAEHTVGNFGVLNDAGDVVADQVVLLSDELINPTLELFSEIKCDIEIGNMLKFASWNHKFKLMFPHSRVEQEQF